MSDQDSEFIGRAIELARQSVSQGGGPFGAVITREGRILAEGQNRVTLSHDPTAHAEIVAIRRACQTLDSFRLDDCVVYASAEPCPMCLAAIYWSRASRIAFAASRHTAARANFDDEFLYEELAMPLEKRKIATTRIDHPDSALPFQEWGAYAARIDY